MKPAILKKFVTDAINSSLGSRTGIENTLKYQSTNAAPPNIGIKKTTIKSELSKMFAHPAALT